MKRIALLFIIMVIVGATVYSATPPSKFKGTGGSAIVNKSADSLGVIMGNDTLWIVQNAFGWDADSMLTRATLDSLVKAVGRFTGSGGMTTLPLDSIFQWLDDNYFDTTGNFDSIFVKLSDSASAVDTSYAPLIALINSLAGNSGVWDTTSSNDTLCYQDTTGNASLCWYYDGTQWVLLGEGLTVVDSLEVNNFIRWVDGTDTLNLTPALVDSIVNQKGVYAAGSGSTDSLYVNDTTALSPEGWKQSGDTLHQDTTQYLAIQDTSGLWTIDSLYLNDTIAVTPEGWILVGDTLHRDTTQHLAIQDTSGLWTIDSIFVDDTVAQTTEGWLFTGDTLFQDTTQHLALQDTANLWKIDTFYVNDTTAFTTEGWITTGDTIHHDTTQYLAIQDTSNLWTIDSFFVDDTTSQSTEGWKFSGDTLFQDTTQYLAIQDTASVLGAYMDSATVMDSIQANVSNPTLNNVTVFGDLAVTGYPTQWQHSTNFDLTYAWSQTGTKLSLHDDSLVGTPTYGGDSTFVHSSVVYIPEGFLGYKVWLAVTGGASTGEEPFIFVTNSFTDDGEPTNFHRFIDSAGGTYDTLFNPVLKDADFGLLSDCHLAFGADEKLWLCVREIANPDNNFVFTSTSDGLTWSTPDTALTLVGLGDYVSPTFFLDTGSTYLMYIVKRDTATDSNKVWMYTAPRPDSGWTFVDTTDMRPTNDVTRDIWHIDIKPYSPDYFLAIIYEATNGGQNQGGISVAYSRDRGLSWSDAKQIFTDDGVGWDAFSLYRSTGYWDNIGREEVFRIIYTGQAVQNDSAWGVGTTTLWFSDSSNWIAWSDTTPNNSSGIASKAFVLDTAISWADTSGSGASGVYNKAQVNDSLSNKLSTGDTKQRKVYIPVDWVSGRNTSATDSVHLSLPGMDGATPYLCKDSNTAPAGGASRSDTLYFWWNSLPYDLVSVDSVLFTYRETGTSTIQDLWCVTPDHTAGSVMADSVHTNDLISTGISSATWSRVARYINLSNQNGGEQFAMKMRTFIDDSSNIFIGRMWLQCTVEYTY